MAKLKLSAAAREAKKQYMKNWLAKNPNYQSERRKKNPDIYRQYEINKWENRAERERVKDETVTGNKLTVTTEAGQKICEICGRFFQPKRSTAMYCGDKCRQRACRAKQKPLM